MKEIFVLLVWLWVIVTVTVAYTGIKLVPQLVILGFAAVSCGLRGLFWQKAWGRYLAVPLIILMILAASLVSFLWLALWVAPPVTPDGHMVMPIGQTFVGIALGFAFSVLLAWLYFKKLKPAPRREALCVSLLFLALTAGLVFDLVY